MAEHGADIPEISPENNSIYPAIWDLVIMDIQKRDAMGTKKYGTRLRPFNGRNSLWDAYQELLDLVVYLRQTIYEMENKIVIPNKELQITPLLMPPAYRRILNLYDAGIITHEEMFKAILEIEKVEKEKHV